MFPNTLSLLNSAFFSPTSLLLAFSISVTVEENISPSFSSNFFPDDCSNISCPKAPYLLLSGSIKVSVPIPEMLSFIYSLFYRYLCLFVV